jgi:hypothetical protein
MGCGQVWYHDHKTWPHWNGGLTEEAFRARARAFVEDPHQCFVHYEVNCRLLAFIAASPKLPRSFFSSSSSSSTTTSDAAALQFPSCRHQHLLAQAPFSIGMSHRHQTLRGGQITFTLFTIATASRSTTRLLAVRDGGASGNSVARPGAGTLVRPAVCAKPAEGPCGH